MDGDEIPDGTPLIEAAASIVVPDKRPLFSTEADVDSGYATREGTCRVAIIRPCVSRGRKVRGLPPIYTPAMLEAHAGVFSGWRMYADHAMAEGLGEEDGSAELQTIVRALQESGRSIKDLGGRVLRSWWDGSVVTPQDEEFGFQRGAIVGEVLPQRFVREMLEVDPEILSVSINAWPKGAREGTAPWDPKTRGALIEGIRKEPEGSVDWVTRPGAGGRVLEDLEALAVSVAESIYSRRDPASKPTRSKNTVHIEIPDDATPEQALAALRAANPSLAESLTAAPAAPTTSLSIAEVEALLDRKLTEQREVIEIELAEAMAQAAETARHSVEYDRKLVSLETAAHRAIESAEGLPESAKAEMRLRYSLLESGPAAGLIVDASIEDAASVVVERVEADVNRQREIIAEASGQPVVEGNGSGESEGEPRSGGAPAGRTDAFREWVLSNGLAESADDVDKIMQKELS